MAEQSIEELDQKDLDEKLNKSRKIVEYYKQQLEILKTKEQIAEMEQKLKKTPTTLKSTDK